MNNPRETTLEAFVFLYNNGNSHDSLSHSTVPKHAVILPSGSPLQGEFRPVLLLSEHLTQD